MTASWTTPPRLFVYDRRRLTKPALTTTPALKRPNAGRPKLLRNVVDEVWYNDLKDADMFYTQVTTLEIMTFLDLNISILPTGGLDTCLFEKALNLYLYLPATSCHPRSVLKGLIIGLLFRIHRLTSDSTLHSNMFKQVFRRLCLRGYTPAFLLPLFERATRYITTVTEPPLAPGPLARPLSIFLHLPFHPDDVNTLTIQRLFRQVFEPTDRLSTRLLRTPSGNTFAYDRLIIAYHRPPNLSNILCPRKFAKTNGASVSTILSSL